MKEEKRKINQGNKSIYVEQGDVYVTYPNDRKIRKFLSKGPVIPNVFLGRSSDLKAVHEKLRSVEKNHLLLINGEGGIGKTTFVAKYWQHYQDEYHHLAWVFTGNNLLDALLTLADELKEVFPKEMLSEDRLNKILLTMKNLDKPCLLVLDNANDVGELDQYCLELKSCDNFHILLTSLITSFEEAETFTIPPLNEIDALTLFKKHYPGQQSTDDELLKAIREAVGGNTLVLELLAKNLAAINSNKEIYPLTSLLRDLQKKGLFGLAREKEIKVPYHHGRHHFINTKPTDVLDALYDEVEMVKPLNEDEKRLLSNLAVLPAEKIDYEQLIVLLAPWDEDAFSETLTDLALRGWLEKSIQANNRKMYKISPVVQDITRHKNQPQLLEHIHTLIRNLIEKLAYDPVREQFVHASNEAAAVYVKYAEFLVNHVDKEDDIGLITLRELKDLYERIASNDERTNLDKATASLGRYNQSIKALCDANPRNEIFKEELALSYSRLGDAHAALGHMKRALSFRIKDIELTRELSKANPKDLAFKNELAISYEKAGDTCKEFGDMQQASAFFKHDFNLSKELYKASPQNEDFINGLAIASEKLREIHIALGDKVQASRIDEECSSLEKERYDEYQHNQVLKISLVDSISQLRQFNWDHRGDKIKAKESVELYYQPEQEPKWTRQRQGKNLSSVTGFGGN